MRTIKRLAVVANDTTLLDTMHEWLTGSDLEIVSFRQAAKLLESEIDELEGVCLSLSGDALSTVDVIRILRARCPALAIVALAANEDVEQAVTAMQAGADDYLVRPLHRGTFPQRIQQAIDLRSKSLHIREEMAAPGEHPALSKIVGRSAPMRYLAQHVQRVMKREISVALIGETGTGKELVADAIHQGGARSSGPFVAINCAAIPASLQESELFGHERGSFTGATTSRRGAFEQAQGGTLFLDELGEMSLETQASLLRVLQEKTIRRVGGTTEIPVDVRIISATSRDLEEEVKAGRFRKDLFYRLVVYPIEMPPLRDRTEDISALAEHFRRKQCEALDLRVERFHPEALEALTAHDWPGNVRELQNVVSRAMVVCESDEVLLGHLPREIATKRLEALGAAPFARSKRANGKDQSTLEPQQIIPIRELERREILRALEVTRGNVARAAQLLEIGRATLYRRIASQAIPFEESAQEDTNPTYPI